MKKGIKNFILTTVGASVIGYAVYKIKRINMYENSFDKLKEEYDERMFKLEETIFNMYDYGLNILFTKVDVKDTDNDNKKLKK